MNKEIIVKIKSILQTDLMMDKMVIKEDAFNPDNNSMMSELTKEEIMGVEGME